MRAAGDQAKTACGNLHLFAGLEAGIKGATHDVGQRRLERARQRRSEGGGGGGGGVGSSDKDEDPDTLVLGLNNLNTETASTEEEAVEGLEAALRMEIEEEGEIYSEFKVEEGCDATQLSLGYLEFLTQDA